MHYLNRTLDYLEEIKRKEISFTSVINKKLNADGLDEQDVNKIKSTLKGVVNCYFFLFWEINSHYFEQDEKFKEMLVVSLAALRYVKNVSLEEIKLFLIEYKEQENMEFDLDEVLEFLSKLKEQPTPIPKKYEQAFAKKMSLRYAYPEWIVRMMIKHFGIKHTFKTLASSRKAVKLSLSVNPFKTNVFDVANSNQDFTVGTLGSLSIRYGGKPKLIEYPEFKNNAYFMMDESNQFVIDNLSPLEGEEVFVYGDNKGLMSCDIALMMNDFGKVYTCANNILDLNSMRSAIKRFELKSIYPFEEANIDLLITHFKEKSFDKVLLFAPSSELGLVRKNPEILLTLKKEDIDGIIEREKTLLEALAPFVKEDGVLVYAVKTINKKESTNIIASFLEAHSDFALVEDRQIFPYEHLTDGVYFAKLQRSGQ